MLQGEASSVFSQPARALLQGNLMQILQVFLLEIQMNEKKILSVWSSEMQKTWGVKTDCNFDTSLTEVIFL